MCLVGLLKNDIGRKPNYNSLQGYGHLINSDDLKKKVKWHGDVSNGAICDEEGLPMLVDGETSLTESCAIAHYLATRDGYTPLAVAPGERDYGEYLDYSYHADATITFPQTVYMRFCLFEKDKGLQEAGHAYAKWFHKRLIKVEERLQGREFLCADRFTVADICVGYALILAQSVGLDDGVPDSLKAYRERLTARLAYQRAFAREEAGRKALTPAPPAP